MKIQIIQLLKQTVLSSTVHSIVLRREILEAVLESTNKPVFEGLSLVCGHVFSPCASLSSDLTTAGLKMK